MAPGCTGPFSAATFPGTTLIPRLYALHVLVLPAIILALIGAHLAMVWFQKHTQFPGPGRTENNVVGVRVMPIFAVKSGAFFALTTGVLGLMGGLLQINPIWNLGPYTPSHVSAGSQPDFYMMWTEGLQRLWPAWEIYIGHHTVPAAVGAAMIMGIVFVLLTIYPFLEKRFSGDYAHHNLLQRPRDVPVRTGIGAMAIAFYLVLTLGAMNDIIALKFHISLNATTWVGRIGMVVLPPIIYFITYRWCVGLQRSDRAVLEHGIETGILKRLPHGAYVELHQPLGPLPLEYQGAPVPTKMNKLGSGGSPGSGSFLFADPTPRTPHCPRPITPPSAARSPRCGIAGRTGPTGSRLSASRPLLGKQAVRVHSVAVVMGDGRDDQFIGLGRVAQPLELVGHLDCGSDKLGFDSVRHKFPVGIAPGVPPRFCGRGERDRAFGGPDAAHPQSVTCRELASGGLVVSHHDVGRHRHVRPVQAQPRG